MSTIEERIAKHERLKAKAIATFSRADNIRNKADNKVRYYQDQILKLKAKLTKQQTKNKAEVRTNTLKESNESVIPYDQKDQEIGKALVESGTITEEQKEAIEKLPLPEEKVK